MTQPLRLIIPDASRGLEFSMQGYLADCQIRNLAPRTLAIYRGCLGAFLAWAGPRDTDAVTADDLRRYMLHLQAQGHNPGGQHLAFRVLRSFFRWLLAEGEIDANPMERLKPPRVPDAPLDPVPLPDVAAMLGTCDRSLLGLRDAALLLTLLDTAARASELLACDIADLDVGPGALVLRHTKSGRQRLTFVGAKARRALLLYLRRRQDAEPAAPLFATRNGGRLTYPGLRQVLRRRAERAGVPAPGAHSFRRAACLAMLRDGADAFTVQQLAGHADLATTRRYVRLLAEDLRRAHAEHSPVDRLLRKERER